MTLLKNQKEVNSGNHIPQKFYATKVTNGISCYEVQSWFT